MKINLIKHILIRTVLFILWIIVSMLIIIYTNQEEFDFILVILYTFISAMMSTTFLIIDTFLLHRRHLIDKRNSNMVLIILQLAFYILFTLKYIIGSSYIC